jgi:hypothetical protein
MSTSTTPAAVSTAEDYDAITQVLNTLLEGESAGDVAKLRRAFHPDARMFGQIGGQRCDMPISDYFAYAAKAPANLENNYRARILSVQQTGEVATAVVVEENCWGSASFVDHFALSRVAGAWTVVNKIFTHTGGTVPM